MADVSGDVTTTATVTAGSTISGTLDVYGDRDWYRIDLQAGQSVTLALNSVGTSPVHTQLSIFGAEGTLLGYAKNSDGPMDSLVTFSVGASGTYYLEAASWDGGTGDFELLVSEAPPLPVFTYDQIGHYLAYDYWTEAGETPRQFDVAPGGFLTVNITALTAEGQFLAREALALWADVTGIGFTEVPTDGQITFDDTGFGAFSESVVGEGDTISSSQVNVPEAWLEWYGGGALRGELNSYPFLTYVHEVGHALGLGHAGAYDGAGYYAVDARYQNDSYATTIMSYFDQQQSPYFQAQGFSSNLALTPMLGDVIAMSMMYGLSTTTRTGDTTYGFNSNAGRAVFDPALTPGIVGYTIVDSGGIDTLDYSGYAAAQRIDLNTGIFSNVGGGVGNVSIAPGVLIENALGGSGNDVLVGNAAANLLAAGAGDDFIDGGSGADLLTGAVGNDIYVVDDAGDVVSELSGSGRDTVQSGISYTLGANVEQLVLTGTTAINGNGNSVNNVLTGNSAANRLDGRYGNDQMAGGGGHDTYIVNQAGDVVTESRNSGTDKVTSATSYTLSDYIEDLALSGTGNFHGTGNSQKNVLNGNGGANLLHGGGNADKLSGGRGDDTLNGGLGNDDLHGGAGLDRFLFDTALGSDVDMLHDFNAADDAIVLDRSIFNGIDADGTLGEGVFHTGAASADGGDRVIYDPVTGKIFYDADGSGAVAAVLFAQVNAGTLLTHSDFTAVA